MYDFVINQQIGNIMQKFLYVVGLLIFLLGFADGPNFLLIIGSPLLIIAFYYDRVEKRVSSKAAAEKLFNLASLRDKGLITEAEFELKSKDLKDKLWLTKISICCKAKQ